MKARTVGGDLDAFAARVQRVAGVVALTGVLAAGVATFGGGDDQPPVEQTLTVWAGLADRQRPLGPWAVRATFGRSGLPDQHAYVGPETVPPAFGTLRYPDVSSVFVTARYEPVPEAQEACRELMAKRGDLARAPRGCHRVLQGLLPLPAQAGRPDPTSAVSPGRVPIR